MFIGPMEKESCKSCNGLEYLMYNFGNVRENVSNSQSSILFKFFCSAKLISSVSYQSQ